MPSPLAYRNFLKILAGLKRDDEISAEEQQPNEHSLHLETLSLANNTLFDELKRFFKLEKGGKAKAKSEQIDYQEEII